MTTATLKTGANEIKVTVTGVGPAIVEIGDQQYFAYDLVTGVRLEKFSTQGGQVYTVKLGTRGCYGCDCPDAKYRRRVCKHAKAADLFLDATF